MATHPHTEVHSLLERRRQMISGRSRTAYHWMPGIGHDRSAGRACSDAALPAWLGYLLSVVTVVSIWALLELLHPYLPVARFPMLYVLAVTALAYGFGAGPAILTFALSMLAHIFTSVVPEHTWWLFTLSRMDWAGLVSLIIGSMIGGTGGFLVRRSRLRIEHLASELRYNRERLALAASAAEIGTWYRGIADNALIWDDKCKALFGLPPNTKMSYDLFMDRIHPDDRGRVDGLADRALADRIDYDVEYRIIRHDGATRWIHATGRGFYDEEGRAERMVGIAMDITERKEAQDALWRAEENKLNFYRRLIEAATNGKLVITERRKIEQIAGPAEAEWPIDAPKDLAPIRHSVTSTATAMDMDPARVGRFVMCLGEAATNALNHAGGGRVYLHKVEGGLMFVVSDRGPGIAALNLPDVALRHGYTTFGSLGMGYKVIVEFADKVYLATGSEGTTVAVEMGIDVPETTLFGSTAELAPGTAYWEEDAL